MMIDGYEMNHKIAHKQYDTSNVKVITLNGKKYVDISVIEDIRKEIEERSFTFFAGQTTLFAVSLEDVLDIINGKLNEVTHDKTMEN